MKRILFIHSSLFNNDSASTQIAEDLVTRLSQENPGSTVTRIDLANNALPHLDADEFNSWTVTEAERTAQEHKLAAPSDALIDQLLAHDTLVLAVPMYNLGIPSTLKAWIDRISRAGKTFGYTANGPVGLVKGMQAYLVFARGGIYRNTPLDTQTGYLTAVLGLMGIEVAETVYAEGLNMGEDIRAAALNEAHTVVSNLFDRTQQEARYAVA